MKYIYILITGWLAFSCQEDEIGVTTIRINHYKQFTVGEGSTLVMVGTGRQSNRIRPMELSL